MADPEDAELVGRSRKGDKEAFSALFQKYQRRVFAFSYRLTRCRETAGDVAQTTFLKAYQSLASIDDPRLFYYWLFSIARNEALGQLRRKHGRVVSVSLDEATQLWDGETPHEKLEREEMHALVERLLGRLKTEYREVLILRQYESLSYAEIASITGDSISAVESRLFKARRALAKYLAPYVK
jgi:RNA polymerase sigma-70 factor, ECF subfamily